MYGKSCPWRANLYKSMIIGKTQFSKMSISIAKVLGYDNHGTNTGHGSRGLGILLAAKSSCGISTLTTFACHTDPKQTIRYAKGDEVD